MDRLFLTSTERGQKVTMIVRPWNENFNTKVTLIVDSGEGEERVTQMISSILLTQDQVMQLVEYIAAIRREASKTGYKPEEDSNNG